MGNTNNAVNNRRISIGKSFDDFYTIIGNISQLSNSTSQYPPTNLVMLSDNQYVLEFACAGYSQNDLSVVVDGYTLIISGENSGEDNRVYLHKGISSKKFERKFHLLEHIEVGCCKYYNGILTIELKKVIPEYAKPKKIPINTISGNSENILLG